MTVDGADVAADAPRRARPRTAGGGTADVCGAVVVGTDASDGAAEAVRWAIGPAWRWSVPLHLVHLGHGPGTPDWLRDLAAEAGRLVPVTVTVEPVRMCQFDGLPVADAADVLLRRSRDARLLVVGSHGRGARGGLEAGPLAERLVREAGCPVAVVRGGDVAGSHGRVVAGVAGPGDDTVAEAAADLAALWDTELLLVHAWSEVEARPGHRLHRDPDRERVRAEAAEALEHTRDHIVGYMPRTAVHTRLTEDTVLRAMLDASAGARAVVVGPGTSGPDDGMALGSTTRGLVGFAGCTVLVSRPTTSPAAAPHREA